MFLRLCCRAPLICRCDGGFWGCFFGLLLVFMGVLCCFWVLNIGYGV